MDQYEDEEENSINLNNDVDIIQDKIENVYENENNQQIDEQHQQQYYKQLLMTSINSDSLKFNTNQIKIRRCNCHKIKQSKLYTI